MIRLTLQHTRETGPADALLAGHRHIHAVFAQNLDHRAVGGNGVAVAVGLQLDLFAVDADDAAGRIFQAVDATQKG